MTIIAGDRVSRPVDVHGDHSIVKYGTVVGVRYRPVPAPATRFHGPKGEALYDVTWDGEETVSRGYLRHGITALEKQRTQPRGRADA